MSILNQKSKILLRDGEVLNLGPYNHLDGDCYVVKHQNSYYYIVDDGTGNNYFRSDSPENVDIYFAISYALQSKIDNDVICQFFDITEEELEDMILKDKVTT